MASDQEQLLVAVKTEELVSELPNGNHQSKFRCYVCSPTLFLASKDSLCMHLVTAHPRLQSYHCEECNQSWSRILAFNNHLYRHDEETRPFKCDHCSLRFSKSENRKVHELLLHNSERLDEHCCEICGRKYFFEKQLRQHHQRKHGGVQEAPQSLRDVLSCYLCPAGSKFDSKDDFLQHLADEHEHKERYHCTRCDYSCDKKTTLNYHLSRHDENRRPFGCSVCSLRFLTIAHKYNHELAVHGVDCGKARKQPYGVKDRKFVCSICGLKFPDLTNLKRHEFRMHREESTVNGKRCYLCSSNNIFDGNDALLKHLKNSHPTKQQYCCSKCDYSSTQMFHLNHHLARHDPSKPYKCNYCEERFMIQQSRSQHEACIHSVDNGTLHSCPKCNEKFSTKRELSRHKRAERKLEADAERERSGDLSCSICNKTFVQWHRKVYHERKVHGRIADVKYNRNALKCYICNHVTALVSKRSLIQHFSEVHPKENEYKCDLCKYKTAKIVNLNSHYARHRASEVTKKNIAEFQAAERLSKQSEAAKIRELTCSFCNKKFKHKYLRIQHECYKHNKSPEKDKESFRCYLCRKPHALSCKRRLETHLESTYPTKSEYKCKPCNFKTKELMELNHHHSQHKPKGNSKTSIEEPTPTGDLPKKFICYLCDTADPLESRDELVLHLVSAHRQQDTYRCVECEFTVNKITLFNQHLAQHDGEKGGREDYFFVLI